MIRDLLTRLLRWASYLTPADREADVEEFRNMLQDIESALEAEDWQEALVELTNLQLAIEKAQDEGKPTNG